MVDGVDEQAFLRRAGWAGVSSVILLALGVGLGAPVGVDAPGVADATIVEALSDGTNQAMAGIALPVLAVGVALLLWFALRLRYRLEQLSGGDPTVHAVVPSAAMFGGLTITGVSITVASAISALTDEFTLDADTARVLGAAGLIVALTGLTGGAVLVMVTTRIKRRAGVLPTWAAWASYVVVAFCISGFWTAGMGSVALALWLLVTSIGLVRESGASAAPNARTDHVS